MTDAARVEVRAAAVVVAATAAMARGEVARVVGVEGIAAGGLGSIEAPRARDGAAGWPSASASWRHLRRHHLRWSRRRWRRRQREHQQQE